MSIAATSGAATAPRKPRRRAGKASSTAGEAGPIAARLQILATEHWSLLATRSLTWNESFSRSGMFLTTLSGSVVALALAAQGTSFGPGFVSFALVVLPVVFFIGLATFVRLVDANREDMRWVQGMNRLRHAYLEVAPNLEPYLVAGWHDDEAGVLTTLGTSPATHGWYHHVLVTTPAVVAVVDGAIGGGIAALAASGSGIASWPSIAIGVATFLTVTAALAAYQRRTFAASRALPTIRFPTPRADQLAAPHSAFLAGRGNQSLDRRQSTAGEASATDRLTKPRRARRQLI